MERLLARAALAVDGGRGGRKREAGGQPSVAPDVQRLLADLAHAPEDDIFDQLWFDARAVNDLLQHERAEDDRMNFLELAVATPDWGSHGLDDHYFAHVQRLLQALVHSILRPLPNASRDVLSSP